MKRIVLRYGLISGAMLSAVMLISLRFKDAIGFDWGMIVGYASMVLAFLLVYFGVRSYRDEVAGGAVRFGRALAVGSLIALVASCCYVVTWEVIYYTVAPDYMAKYQEHELGKAQASGATTQEIAKKRAEMAKFAELYKNPLVNAAMTFVEPLPVAILAALVSAGLLSRRRKVPLGQPRTVVVPGGA